MAANKPKAPKKYKQARKAAVADAKGAFSSGKTKARLKDRTLKITADDKKALSEVKAESKGNYITDDRGNKINVKPTETAQERFARDRREAKAAVDRMYAKEDAAAQRTSGDAKVTDKRTPVEKKASLKAASKEVKKNTKKLGSTKKASLKVVDTPVGTNKPGVNKPATKGYSAGKTLNATGQARYDALIKEGVAPKKAMNKALFAQEKTTKATASKPMTKNDALKFSAKGKVDREKTLGKVATKDKPKFVQSTRTNTPVTSKELAIRPKTSTAVVGKTESTAAKVAKKGGKLKALGKKFVGATLAAEGVSALKGSTEKDFRYIQKLENQLAKTEGRAPKYKNMGSNKNFVESSKADLSNIAALVSLGTVGKTRRERMDELNAKLKKAEAKRSKEIMSRKIPAGQYPKGGGKGLKINPKMVTPGSGGSTSSAYTVKRGDTLSAIAKTSGVKLSELLAANTKFKTDAKYKGGSMIWAGTKVKLPKK
jgi:hypothetical protein